MRITGLMWHQTHTRYLERRLLIPQIFLPHRQPWRLVIRTQTVPMVSVFKGYMLWTQCLLGKLDTYSWCHSSGCDFISQLWQTCDVSSCRTLLTTIQQFEILGHVDFSTRSRGCTLESRLKRPMIFDVWIMNCYRLMLMGSYNTFYDELGWLCLTFLH